MLIANSIFFKVGSKHTWTKKQNICRPVWPESCQFGASHLMVKRLQWVSVVELGTQGVKLSGKVLILGR